MAKNTQKLPESVRFIRRPWRRNRRWSGFSRVVASLTAFAFLLTQVVLPLAAAAEPNELPRWLRQEEGGWVSPEQAGRMQRADQDLLAHLSALEGAQQRFTLSHPSGLQTLFVHPEPFDSAQDRLVEGRPAEPVVSRDAAGNLLWSPTLDDYQKLRSGTLLLADGTLQVVRNGVLARQVDALGNESFYRADGRVEREIAADGTQIDTAYIDSPAGVLQSFTRTTHTPTGDLRQEYNAEGALQQETLPDGWIFRYDAGFLRQTQTGSETTQYSYHFNSDGNSDSVTVTTSAGVRTYNYPSGALQTLTDLNGTQWAVDPNGWITRSTAPNGIITTYSRTDTPLGQQIQRTTGGITDRFSFDPQGRLYAAASDRSITTGNPFLTAFQTVSFSPALAARVVATDGTYLYVKAGGGTSAVFQKIGTGKNGTTTGKNYGTLTGAVKGSISAAIVGDGMLYQPDPTNLNRLERINPANGQKAFVSLATPFLPSQSSATGKWAILITSDGRYVYNLSSHRNNGSAVAYNGWTVRVYDPQNGWAMVREFTTGTASYAPAGFWSDGVFLYLLENKTSGTAKTTTIRIADGAAVSNSSVTASRKLLTGQYDWRNQRLWVGTSVAGKIHAHDDPNDLPLFSWSDREGLRSPAAQRQLGEMNRLRQPSTGLPPTDTQRWKQAAWPVTADLLPPTGSAIGPALTSDRQITLALSALDPAAADGTTGSGVLRMRFSTDGGATWSEPEPVAEQKVLSLPETDGTYSILIQFQDLAGNAAAIAWTVTLDTIAPAAVLTSATLTNQPDYTLSYSVDGVNQTEPIILTEGENTLTRSFSDAAGNSSTAAWTVTLDTVPPAVTVGWTGRVSPSSGIRYTASREVGFNLQEQNGSSWTVAESSLDQGQTWTPLTVSENQGTLTLPDAAGEYLIQLRFTDAAGNRTVVTESMVLDRAPPAGSASTWDGGKKGIEEPRSVHYLASPEVGVWLQVQESLDENVPGGEIAEVGYSVDQGQTWTTVPWPRIHIMTFPPPPDFQAALPPGDGQKDLRIRLIDSAGWKTEFSPPETLLVDTTPPTPPTITAPDRTNGLEVNLRWEATDQTSGVAGYRWRIQEPDGIWSEWAEQTESSLILRERVAAEGLYRLEVQAQDAAGYWSETATHAFTIDRTAPALVLTSAAVTNQRNYTLTYTADGVTKQEQVTLGEGDNPVERTESDAAGNTTTAAWTVTLDTLAPVLSLGSSEQTDSERYDVVIQADGRNTSIQTFLLGRGTHRFPATGSDEAGNASQAWLTVTRTGSLPEPQDPPAIPEGARVTQTLSNGSRALYVDGTLASVTQTDETWLSAPTLDSDGRITGGWLTGPDGTITYLQNGSAVWSKTPLGAVYWYLADSKLGAVRSIDGTVTVYGYRLNDTGEVAEILASTDQGTVLMNAAGEVLERIAADGSPLPMDPANPPQAALALAEDAAGRVGGMTSVRDGITRTYDAQGRLVSLHLADGSNLSVGGDNLQAVTLPDGTQVRDGVYDAQNHLVSGIVTLPDRRVITYAGGLPIEARLPDGSVIGYANGEPRTLTFADGSGYALTFRQAQGERATEWIATLNPDVIPVQTGIDPRFREDDTLTQLVYTEDWVLLSADRADGARLLYSNGRLSTLTQTNGTAIYYNYDLSGRLTSTVAVPPSLSGTELLRIEYADEKIRKVYRGDTLLYHYSFEMGPDGMEITRIEDLPASTVRTYRANRLIRVEQSRPGETLHVYDYAYEGPLTLITDEIGVRRTYGEAPLQVLLALERDGRRWIYTYHRSPQAGQITRETLDVDASTQVPETIVQREFDSDGILLTQTRADGLVTRFKHNQLFQVLDSAGQLLLEYEYGADGQPTAVHFKKMPPDPKLLEAGVYPILRDYYRRIRGRDPSTEEYADWIQKLDYSTGQFITGWNQIPILVPARSAVFDGGYLSLPDSDNWDMSTGGYTVDFWVKHTNLSGTQTYVGHGDSNHHWMIRHVQGSGLEFAFSNGSIGDLIFLSGGEITDTEWHHVALVQSRRPDGQIEYALYKDGSRVASTFYNDNGGFSGSLEVGRRPGAGEHFQGYLQELRLSKGTDRWTSDFTPSAIFYEEDGNTQLMLRATNTSPVVIEDVGPRRHPVTMNSMSVSQDIYHVQRVDGVIRTPILTDLGKALSDALEAFPESSELQAASGPADTVVSEALAARRFLFDSRTPSYMAVSSTLFVDSRAAANFLRTEYAYDKIRKVYKGSMLIYDYSYEFDEARTDEITVIRDMEAGLTKRYRDGLLISQTDSDGAVTTYEYGTDSTGYTDPFETAVGAVQTLLDGTVAEYESFKLKELLLTNGSRLLLTDGKITGVIHPDGRMEESLNPSNLLGEFASLETWSNHSPFDAPDGWKFGFDTGSSIAWETSPENVHSGSSSVKLTTGPGGGDSFIYRDIVPMYSPELDDYEGKTVTLGAWVKTSDPEAYLGVLDGVIAGTSRSENHPGDGQWHFLTVTRVNGTGGISKLIAFLNTHGPNTTAYLDDAVFIVGPAALTRDFSGLLAEAALPDGRTALRRMVENGTLQLIQPDALDQQLQTAVSAVRTLSNGTKAHYDRTTDPAQPWKLTQLTRPDGTAIASAGKIDDSLTDVNGLPSAEGKIGRAARFSPDSSRYLTAPDSEDLSMGDIGFTLAAWVYIDAKNGSPDMDILGKGIQSVGSPNIVEYQLRWGGPYDRFEFLVSDGSSGDLLAATSYGSPPIGQWIFVVAWHDAQNNTLNLQVNNGPINSVGYAVGSHDSVSPLTIGRSPGLDRNYWWNGKIDEVGLWKKALTTQERADLYNAGAGNTFDLSHYSFETDTGKKLADGLVTYYTFDETVGPHTDSANPSSLLAQAILPTGRTDLRRMVDQGTLTFVQPDTLDRSIQSAAGAVQTLPDGTTVEFDRNRTITQVTKPDGSTIRNVLLNSAGLIEKAEITLSSGDTKQMLYAYDRDPRGSVISTRVTIENIEYRFNQDGNLVSSTLRSIKDGRTDVTLVDDTRIDTTQSKLGGAAVVFDGNGDYLSTPDSDDWTFGQSDFTLDFWVRFDALKPGETTYFFRQALGPSQWDFLKTTPETGNRLNLQFYDNNVGTVYMQMADAWSPDLNRWYHIAAERAGQTGFIFIDGIAQPLQILADFGNQAVTNVDSSLMVGFLHRGWMDEIRLSKGIARWTSNFTPNTEEYASDEYTQLLLHFKGTRYQEGIPTAPITSIPTVASLALFPQADRASLRRMIDQGTLQLVQPPAAIASEGTVPAQGLSPAQPASVLTRATVTYQGKTRDNFTYRYAEGKTRVTDSVGVTRTYDGTKRLVAIEQSDGTRYDVSYDRDLSESQILRIANLHSDDPELLRILKNPQGDQIVTHRLTQLALPGGSVTTSHFSDETVVEQEFDASGNLISRTQANGQVTLYEDNRPLRTYDPQGNVTTLFDYDSAGRLIKITLVAARREIADQITQLKAAIPVRHSQALEELAHQRGIAIDQVSSQFSSPRSQLQDQLSSLQNQLNSLEGTNVHGKKAKRQKGQALDQIRSAMNQVRDAQNNLEAQYAQALGNLESQVESVRAQIETESSKALADISVREQEFGLQILGQEISSIVRSTARSTIGRDLSDLELQAEVQRLYDRYGTDPAAAVDLTDLTQRIQALPDYAPRAAQVAAIKQQVSNWLTEYVESPSVRAELVEALGLSASEVVPLSSSDVERILAWLNSRSLHFGHSAFLALQEYLVAQGVHTDLVSLAVQTILTDILSGVITPKTIGDLEISLFALERVAQLHGGAATPAQVSLDDLRSILATEPVIAHVNGNHYIFIQSIADDGTVTYREPNAGPTGQTLTMTQAEFQKVWEGNVLSARAPPQAWQILTDREAQRITGSFFPLIFFAIAWIASTIGAAIAAVVGAIATLLAGLGTLISGIFSALGTVFGSIGSFFGGFGSLFSGAGLIGQGFSAIFAGNLLAGLGLIGQGVLTGLGITSLAQFALTTAINIGVSKGLEALGVSSTISSLAGALVSGGISGALNPVSATSSFLTNFASGALTSTAVAGTQIGLVKAGLDPALAGIASIGVGAITGAMLSGVSVPSAYDSITHQPIADSVIPWHTATGLAGLSYTLSTNLVPTLAGELAYYGVQKLGASIGLDPRISQLAGITVSHGIRNITNSGNTAQNVIRGMQNGLIRGATQVGLQFATQGLDPLLGSLASSAITSAIDGLVSPPYKRDPKTGEILRDPTTGQPLLEDKNGDGIFDNRDRKGIFQGFADSLTSTIGGFTEIGLIKPGDPVATAQGLAKLNDFSTIIREQGLGTALDTYATSIFYRSSIESLLNAGSSVGQYGTIKQSIEAQMAAPLIVELEGKNVVQISLGNDANGNLQYIWLDPNSYVPVATLQGQDYIKYGTILVDPTTRTLGAPNAEITRTIVNPLTAEQVTAKIHLETAGADWIEIQDPSGISYRITPNNSQHVRLNANGTIKDGILTDRQAGTKLYFRDGVLVNTRRIGRAVITIGNDGKVTVDGSTLEPKDANQMAVEFSIDEQIHNGEITSDIQLDLDDAQKGILNNLNIDYPFMAQAFAEEVSKTENKAESSNYLKHRYEAYNRLNDAEKAFVRNPLNWGLTQRFEEAAIVATNLAVQKAIASGPSQAKASIHNGKADAFRHALWAALLVQTGRTDKAKQYLDAHEQDPEQSLFEKEMDSHNNTAGIEIGKSNPNASIDQLVSLIDQAMKDNKLTWLNDD